MSLIHGKWVKNYLHNYHTMIYPFIPKRYPKSREGWYYSGFYLGTRLSDDGSPIKSSPFGDTLLFFNRNKVIGEKLVILSLNNCKYSLILVINNWRTPLFSSNLYFNGFYCYFGKGSAHYVSLVLADSDSRNDRFEWNKIYHAIHRLQMVPKISRPFESVWQSVPSYR